VRGPKFKHQSAKKLIGKSNINKVKKGVGKGKNKEEMRYERKIKNFRFMYGEHTIQIQNKTKTKMQTLPPCVEMQTLSFLGQWFWSSPSLEKQSALLLRASQPGQTRLGSVDLTFPKCQS
jgi:hypothetical protein